jgi:hypothetical protein
MPPKHLQSDSESSELMWPSDNPETKELKFTTKSTQQPPTKRHAVLTIGVGDCMDDDTATAENKPKAEDVCYEITHGDGHSLHYCAPIILDENGLPKYLPAWDENGRSLKEEVLHCAQIEMVFATQVYS